MIPVRTANRAATSVPASSGAALRVGGFDETLESGAWFDWYMRAQAGGVREVVLDDVYVRRRIHGTNNWAAQDQSGTGYLRALRSWVHQQRDES